MHAHTLHERFFCHLQLPHLQLDELRTRLRSSRQILWLWLAIDPLTKILPVLQLGPRTQHMAHALIYSLRQSLVPSCIPLFISDGLNVYFYALTAHFGHWLHVGRRGQEVLRWQVAAGLIYGQVKKIYQRRKLVRVRHLMRLGTQADLSVALQGMGLTGRLNTAFIERVNLTVQHGIAAAFSSHLGDGSAVPTPVSSPRVVARLLPFCASSPIAAGDACAAMRAKWQIGGATLPAANTGDGSRQNQPAMDGARSALLPLAASFRLSTT